MTTRRSKGLVGYYGLGLLLLLGGSTPLLVDGFSIRTLDRSPLPSTTRLLRATTTQDRSNPTIISRREWFSRGAKTVGSSLLLVVLGWNNGFTTSLPPMAHAAVVVTNDESDDFFNDPDIQQLYDNPNIPKAPEERSGLVVLRVAEVAQFQEQILRSIASGEVTGVKVSPMQFAFGTKILLKNSNLDGNMRLMIQEEIPPSRRKEAAHRAANAMNQLQEIATFSGSIQRDFETIEMVQLADMYRNVRVDLNQLYEYLPEKDKNRYYGYFVAVTEYEKKIAEGTYNPDLDGVLKFDDSREHP